MDAATLGETHYLLLVTFRADGRAVPTPVWCGEHAGRLYMRTVAGSAKTRRIRANPRVEVAACEADGKPLSERIAGRARLLASADPAIAVVDAQLDRKYGDERLAMTRSVRDEQGLALQWIEVSLAELT